MGAGWPAALRGEWEERKCKQSESLSLAAPSPRLELGQGESCGKSDEEGEEGEETIQVRSFPWYRTVRVEVCCGRSQWSGERGGEGQKNVLEEQGRGWGRQINSGKQGI